MGTQTLNANHANNGGGRTVAIIAMFFLFAMISFVTNLAAPIGTIWGYQFEGNSFLGMLGNMMNFLAYLIMGIPAGKMLTKVGYKKTALWAMAIGFVGLFVQWLSSVVGTDTVISSSAVNVMENFNGQEFEIQKTMNVTFNFIIYLLGAFISGFCVCMLNTVVNPMLNLLGGGGNKGNQLIQTGGALNSLSGTLTPFFVGALIGQLSRDTKIGDVAVLLWVAMAIFAVAFVIIGFVKIPEPNLSRGKKIKYEHSAWNFRHTVLGVIAIFFYVGVEVSIPGTLNFYLSDQKATGAGVLGDASTIAGAVVAIYWLLMLVGRSFSGVISGKVSTRTQLISVSGVCIILLICSIFAPKESRVELPSFVYNPTEKVTNSLQAAGMKSEEISAFIANPSEEQLNAFTEEQTMTDTDGIEHTRALVKGAEKSPSEIIASLKDVPSVPMSALLLILCGLCTSVMWGGIFNLAVDGLGKYTAQASGIFMMMVVGGGVLPLLQQLITGSAGYMPSYWMIVAAVGYIFFYAIWGSVNVNKDIPVDVEELDEEPLV
ncbi:MAG: MFS transporter [Muribaculum sp.]|nr:MFS transporter [Muribaculum sp.]